MRCPGARLHGPAVAASTVPDPIGMSRLMLAWVETNNGFHVRGPYHTPSNVRIITGVRGPAGTHVVQNGA